MEDDKLTISTEYQPDTIGELAVLRVLALAGLEDHETAVKILQRRIRGNSDAAMDPRI